jgi:HSP20 family protein
MNMIVRKTWNPLADYFGAATPFERAFGNTFATASPALDVSETDQAFLIKAALPGWKPEQIGVTFENNVLTLSGELAEEAEKSEPARVHWKEIRQSAFSRSIKLPAEVDAEKIVAEFEHGVLNLSVPKAELAKPRQIKIAVK